MEHSTTGQISLRLRCKIMHCLIY